MDAVRAPQFALKKLSIHGASERERNLAVQEVRAQEGSWSTLSSDRESSSPRSFNLLRTVPLLLALTHAQGGADGPAEAPQRCLL